MNTTFHMLKGKLRVAAQGFWYTSGGEKGSFGYYPHLKDSKGYPVFPDTQIHGDLLMAARWARELGVDGALLDRLFGKRGEMAAALLHVGDLTVPANAWIPDRFQIKPRIEIDDTTRSVKDKMLANFEASWLEGITLEAPLYAGYFTNDGDLKKAQLLLDEAARLLSGFGAFRSRGYGRGTVSIAWDAPETVTIAEGAAGAGSMAYTLESLVNVRSKPVAVEQLQLVSSSTSITADQLRGWFVRTWQQVTGSWPTADDMAGIRFSDLYPSNGDAPAYPPPMTTLRKEDGTSVDDYWGRAAERGDESENLVSCKLKPLKPGSFVAANGAIVAPTLGTRMRNAIQDDFRTLDEGGLYVQQHLAHGTKFCGTVIIKNPDSAFGKQAGAILTAFKPTINGCLFSANAAPLAPSASVATGPRLVTMPIAFDPSHALSADPESITIGTGRRYSPVLGRPRRGRPVILPGSVLVGSNLPETVSWPMFGKNIGQESPNPKSAALWKEPERPEPLSDLKLSWDKITRSQAGVLRELLNTDHNSGVIGNYLKDIRDKHAEKSAGSDPAKLYSALVSIMDAQGIEQMRSTVSGILDHLKTGIWWQDKKKRAGRDA